MASSEKELLSTNSIFMQSDGLDKGSLEDDKNEEEVDPTGHSYLSQLINYGR